MNAHLDEPFNEEPSEFTTTTAMTPTGEEFVFDDECEEVTKVYPIGRLEWLLIATNLHYHKTVESMPACKAK